MKSFVTRAAFAASITATIAGAVVVAMQVGCRRSDGGGSDPRPQIKVVNNLRDSINVEGAGGGAAVVIDPTGWATIRGVITVDGSVPTPQELDAKSNDPCGVVIDNTVQVNPSNKGLRAVLVYLSDGLAENDLEAPEPKWVHPNYRLTDDNRTVVFDQKNCLFLDRTYAMRTDQVLKIKNSDSFAHNTQIRDRMNRTLPGNSFFDWTDPKSQSRSPVSVSCAIHPWMRADMMFRDNPYFAVTDENGQFEIQNVPSGVKLEFRFWHPASNYLSDVTLNGEATSFSKGKYKIKQLEPEQELELAVAVPSSTLQ